MSLKSVIKLNKTKIGSGNAPLFLADIGTFFNQDLTRAEKLISKLSDIGIKFVKGELLHNPDICLKGKISETYYHKNKGYVSEDYYSLIRRKTLPLSAYKEIFGYFKKHSLNAIMSVYDIQGADFALDHGVVALKIASSNIDHEPLIRHCASSGIPLIIDTGKSSFHEISQAVEWFLKENATDLILEHSPPPPPTDSSLHNLKMIDRLHRYFGCPTGLSDHHHGAQMLYASIALGANLVEKGFNIDNRIVDQDVSHSMDLSSIEEIYNGCIDVFRAVHSENSATMELLRKKPQNRMGLIAKTNIEKNVAFSLANVDFAFPCIGISCSDWSNINGKLAKTEIPVGQPISYSDVQ